MLIILLIVIGLSLIVAIFLVRAGKKEDQKKEEHLRSIAEQQRIYWESVNTSTDKQLKNRMYRKSQPTKPRFE